MSESFIEPSILNTGLISLDAFVDDSGDNKMINSQLSSSNFDGLIPLQSETMAVSDIQVGMSFLPLGETEGALRTVIQIDYDQPGMEDVPSNEYTLYYVGDNGDVQSVTYDGDDVLEVSYEDIDNIFLGSTGWTITQGGNAIFSNVFARGRIEATNGFLENLGITGTLSIESGGSISVGANIIIDEFGIRGGDGENETFNLDSDGNLTLFGTISGATISGDVIFEDTGGVGGAGQIATNEDVTSNGGIYMDDTGLYAYNTSGEPTFSIDAETGDVEIFGYASEAETASALGILEDEIDALYDEGFLTDEDLSDTGSTIISGNRITTGVINANLVNISSGLTGLRGVKLNSLGLFAYNSSGQQTFRLNSQTGEVTISGYATDADLENLDYLTEEDIFITGTTNISGNRIRTGVLEGLVYRSNASITRTSGDGVYFDNAGYLRIAKGSSVLSFNGLTGALTIGAGADIEGYYSESDFNPANFVEFPDLASYATYAALSNAGQTVINGGNITTGVIDSFNYNGTGDPVNGTSFSTAGMAINISTGAIITPNFRMSSSGDAEFRGTIKAGRGTFTGAAPETVDGLTRVRYNPSGYWITAESPTIEITRNAGLNSTGYLSIYRPASTSSNSAVGIALFSQGGSGDEDSSFEAVMRGAIEYGASPEDGFETGGMLRILAMPSRSGNTPGKIKMQAAGENTKIQLHSTNLILKNSKEGSYNPEIQVANAPSTALLGIRTTDGVVSLGPRISWGTSSAQDRTGDWSPGPKNGDLHFQF